MIRNTILILLILLALFIGDRITADSAVIVVDETAIRLLSTDETTVLQLTINNQRRQPINAHIEIQILDQRDASQSTIDQNQLLNPGENIITLPISLKADNDQLLWYRLHYRVSAASTDEKGLEPVEDIISLSELNSNIFNLAVIAPQVIFSGATIQAQVRAEHIITTAAIGNVLITVALEANNIPLQTVSARTDDNGNAQFKLKLPQEIQNQTIQLKVTGRLGSFTQTLEKPLSLSNQVQCLISTDKSIYQPGQTLHTRMLLLDPGRQAAAGQAVRFAVLDPENKEIFSNDLTTSKFGVAAIDWPIPADTSLGQYLIQFYTIDSSFQLLQNTRQIKISRYELPNFTIITKPDRNFYLPSENAEIEVRADYLFGQPIRHGKVKIVHQLDRNWNNPQPESESSVVVEGETDDQGRYLAHIDLTSEREIFNHSDFKLYQDFDYRVYYTDLTNNRTETQQMRLRITREPIHIYLSDNRTFQKDQPLEFYLSTFYADGSPAQCQLDINLITSLAEIPFSQFTTNQYGMAKVTLAVPGEISAGNDKIDLQLVARDRAGKAGSSKESFYLNKSPSIRISTDRAIYRAHEPINLKLKSFLFNGELVLYLHQGDKLLLARTVKLVNGSGELTIPYRDNLTGVITITAVENSYSKQIYQANLRTNNPLYIPRDYLSTAVNIVYPDPASLRLNLKLDRNDYQPGDEVKAQLRAYNADGPVESLLGVTVIDRAVDEYASANEGEHDRADASGFTAVYKQQLNDFQAIAGVTPKDLLQLDRSKPIPADLQLLADVIFNSIDLSGNFRLWSFQTPSSLQPVSYLYYSLINSQFGLLNTQLLEEAAKYDRSTELADLQHLIEEKQLSLDLKNLRDPWGRPYLFNFSFQGNLDTLTISSSGPDKQAGNGDDFIVGSYYWPRLRKVGEATTKVIVDYFQRNGRYLLDVASLQKELLSEGIDLAGLLDRWSRPYKIEFQITNQKLQVNYISAGPDDIFDDSNRSAQSDDIRYWQTEIDYHRELRAKVLPKINHYLEQAGRYPQAEAEFFQTIKESDEMLPRDPWNNPYYLNPITIKRAFSYYNDYLLKGNFIAPNENGAKSFFSQSATVPENDGLALYSCGMDGRPHTTDDFEVMVFGYGSISGVVRDEAFDPIDHATIKLINLTTLAKRTVVTNAQGRYLIANLISGDYQIECTAPERGMVIITNIHLLGVSDFSQEILLPFNPESGYTIDYNVIVDPSMQSTQNIETNNQTLTQIAYPKSSNQRNYLSFNQIGKAQQNSTNQNRTPIKSTDLSAPSTRMITPRLRADFRETILWQPEIEVDKHGRAKLKFRLADNTTTWKLMVIGSTVDGQFATSETEFTATQPFIVDHNPPPVLTEGDELSLPVVLHNYLTSAINVDVEMKPEEWFTILGGNHQQCRVPSADDAEAIIRLRASAAIKDGKQRVTASGIGGGDAVEKQVTVNPNGEQLAQVDSLFFNNQALELNLPKEIIRDSVRAELKFYPNLTAHVFEGIEGLLKRPYGCAEQTISSTYPNLLVLRYLKENNRADSLFAEEATQNLRNGYQRLLGYQSHTGGFSYWDKGPPDLSLTAYALKFLVDAGELIDIDQSLKARAADWLAAQQLPDGNWPVNHSQNPVTISVYITRILSSIDANNHSEAQNHTLTQAFNFLDGLVESDKINEAYTLASYILASTNFGRTLEDSPMLAKAVEKLCSLAIRKDRSIHWQLNGNTPFYGWGEAGDIETTALAVRALSSINGHNNNRRINDRLIADGLFYLLSKKDQYGVWHSTQTTINVFDTLIKLSAHSSSSNNGRYELLIDKKRAGEITINNNNNDSAPLTLDITRYLTPGINQLELRRIKTDEDSSTVATDSADSKISLAAQATLNYFMPWPARDMANSNRSKTINALKFELSFDKTSAAIGDEITGKVVVERVDPRSHGMLLAEIGLPPGMDVDRASLDQAMKLLGSNLNRYEIQPDRLVVYLWPDNGKAQFEFKLKARYGIKAQSAASQLYDYYNPDARVVLAPIRFTIR